MKIVLFSATEFGAKCLDVLLDLKQDIVGILTIGRNFKIRGKKERFLSNIRYIDIKQIGKKLKIPVVTVMDSLANTKYLDTIKKWQPDFILVAGWYYLVPKSIRDIPDLGCAGFHASLLPKFSGAAPLTWAIIKGEKVTGLTFFYLDEGIDSGDIIFQRKIPIELEDTIATLIAKSEQAACEILRGMIPLIRLNKAPRIAQNGAPRTIYPFRSSEDGLINWNSSSTEIYNFIRAQTYPYPGAFTTLRGRRLTIWEGEITSGYHCAGGRPGEVLGHVDNKSLKGTLVCTRKGDSPLLLTKVQLESESLSGVEFAKRFNITKGQILGRE